MRKNEIDEVLRKEFELFQKFIETIHAMSIRKLFESTQSGNVYVKELDTICKNIHKYNNRLNQLIFEESQPSEFEYRNIIRDINSIRTPTVISIMNNVFADNGYDEDDKRDVHKYCQIYDYLLNKFAHNVHLIQLKYKSLRQYHLRLSGLKLRKNMLISEKEIEKMLE